MDGSRDIQGAGPDGNNDHATTEIWGAKNSLRSLAGLDKKLARGETTPLLGNGSGSDSDNGNNGDSSSLVWQGDADFEGLSWRKKPSVS